MNTALVIYKSGLKFLSYLNPGIYVDLETRRRWIERVMRAECPESSCQMYRPILT
jgi:hypothetical protein